jgi:microcystin degradation protein MlrC
MADFVIMVRCRAASRWNGPTVVFDTGKVEIVVISRHQEPNDYACVEAVGIDATRKRYLMLKAAWLGAPGFAQSRKRSSNAPASAYARRTTDCFDSSGCADPSIRSNAVGH